MERGYDGRYALSTRNNLAVGKAATLLFDSITPPTPSSRAKILRLHRTTGCSAIGAHSLLLDIFILRVREWRRRRAGFPAEDSAVSVSGTRSATAANRLRVQITRNFNWTARIISSEGRDVKIFREVPGKRGDAADSDVISVNQGNKRCVTTGT